MAALDSISPGDLLEIERAAARAAALRGDSVYSQIDPSLSFPPLPMEAVTQTDSFTAFLATPWGFPVFCGVLVVVWFLGGWVMSKAGKKALLAAAAAKAKEEAQSLEVEQLRAQHEHLLTLLRKRDRYMLQYQAVVLLSPEHLTEWDRANWKEVARNQLAMIQAVRPVVYADYRAKIRALSTTRGNLPGAALQAWQDSRLMPSSEPLYTFLEPFEPAATVLEGESVIDYMVRTGTTEIPDFTDGELPAEADSEPLFTLFPEDEEPAVNAGAESLNDFIARAKEGNLQLQK